MSDKKIYLGKVIQNLQSAPASNSSSFVNKTPRGSSDKVARENKNVLNKCEFCAHEHVYGKWMEFHHDSGASESVEIPAKFCPNCGRRLEK